MFAAYLALATLSLSAFAQDHTGRTISAVNISGLERISEQVVRARLEVQAGQAYSGPAIARDIRRLHELGHFATIRADAALVGEQVVLTYVVQEKQVVANVEIVGNRQIRDRAIRAVLRLREGDAFLPEVHDEERQAILDLYEEKGFANTTVDVVAERVGPARVRLTYNITEGQKARIRSLQFVGNDALSDRALRRIVQTTPARWFMGGRFSEQEFERDLQRILDAYGDVGRLEAEITSTDVTYTSDGRRMNITIFLEEGPEYRVNILEVANNVVFDDDEILNIVDIHAGDVHNRGQIASDARLVQQGYQDSGYVNAQVTPQVTLDRERKLTHVVHSVREGELKYMREIQITGNDVTKDEIVRREVLLTPGERFDGTATQETVRQLENTTYFDDIRVGLREIPDDDVYTDMLIDLEEGSTGVFNAGVGYSTEDGMGGFGEVTLRNFDLMNWPRFSGAGQQLNLRLHVGERRNEYSLGFTEPQFLGYPLSFGFDVFDESYRVRGGQNYREQQQGGQLRFGKMLSPYVQARASLRYVRVDNSEFPFLGFLMHPELRDSFGKSTTVSTTWQIERNTIDRFRDPSRGSRHMLTMELAGLGGDHNFIKFEHDSTWYHPLTDDERWVVSFRTREGYVTEYGGSRFVPLQDRFYAGGSTTVRGFRTRDIGPKVLTHGWFGDLFAVGGDMRWITNTELKYKSSEMLRLYGFVDTGGVWRDSIDLGEMRYSAGVGMGFDVPRLGPIRIDVAYPLNADSTQASKARLHLNTGFSF